MLEFNLKLHRKIRIWFERNTHLVLPGNKYEFIKYPAHSSSDFFSKTVIVELLIPQGAKCSYGLLGADYKKIVSNDIKIKIFGGDNTKSKILKGALIEKIEPAYLFLPEEFQRSVFNKIESIATSNSIDMSGELEFCYGAYSDISSSPKIFGTLYSLIFTLFHYRENEVTSALLNQLIEVNS